MPLTPGVRLGLYEIVALLGAGGMGEVYRARDTKLGREVAIKVVLDGFAADPERVARFQREAQVLAALNHPHIGAIYGLEQENGSHFLVLELVEGETLADRLRRGPLAVDVVLRLALQIAAALEAAHEKGVVHRDLKPANVKITPDEQVKVLDFGLAKSVEPTGAGGAAHAGAVAANLTHSPTLSMMATQVGMILGTAAYMSPEQAKGLPADLRSDVFSFGVVIYEMLTGRQPFQGETAPDILASVLVREADLLALPPDLNPRLHELLKRCLDKNPKKRWQAVGDLRAEIETIAAAPHAIVATMVAARPAPLWRRVAVLAGVAVAALALGGTAVWFSTRPSAARVTRFALSPTGAAALSVDTVSRDVTITPDGSHIVYKGGGGATGMQLIVRALDQLEPTPLTGLSSPRAPFPSPDGQWIGFVDAAAQRLKKVAITGGPALPLCGIDGNSRGATWGDDDSIIFATNETATGLQRVSSAGGERTVLTKPSRERGEADHLWPQFLPGSQAVLFTITATTGGIDAAQVAVLDLRTGTYKVLVRGGSQAQYVPSGLGSPKRVGREGGHLVYAAAGGLRAVAFDLERMGVTGTSIPVLPQMLSLPTGTAEFDLSRSGTLVYVPGGGGVTPPRTLVWVDRQGHEEAIKEAPARSYVAPRLSPDGTRAALEISDQENDIWVWDFARKTLTKVTSDPGLDRAPAWISDSRVVFNSQANGGVGSIFSQAADGIGTAEPLTTTQSASVQFPSGVSPDGTHLLFSQAGGTIASDVMMLTMDKDRRVQPLVQTQSIERNGVISPDGRWLAYQSNDSGSFEISVRPFPDVNKGKWQVSTSGGTQPLWAGQELFYVAPGGALMSVRVERGATWTASTPSKVIEAQYYYGGGVTGVGRTYDVSSDGKRFLMIKEAGAPDQATSSPTIVVVQNWIEELKRLVPTK